MMLSDRQAVGQFIFMFTFGIWPGRQTLFLHKEVRQETHGIQSPCIVGEEVNCWNYDCVMCSTYCLSLDVQGGWVHAEG